MTIQEVGNNTKWIEILAKAVKGQVKNILVSGEDTNSLDVFIGDTRFQVWALPKLGVYVYVYIYDRYCCRIGTNGTVNITHSNDTYQLDCLFHNDTEGICILVDELKATKPGTSQKVLSTIIETERIYSEKYYGRVQGNKFGF